MLYLQQKVGYDLIMQTKGNSKSEGSRTKENDPVSLDGYLTPEDKMKYEIAKEIGVLDKVLEKGWKSLSAKESGRIGGLMTKRKREGKH